MLGILELHAFFFSLSALDCMYVFFRVYLQKYVQMSALDDKDVPSAEQWNSAVKFMTSAVRKEIKSAEDNLDKLVGPTSFYNRWVNWRSQSETESKRQAIAEELTKFLNAEPVRLVLALQLFAAYFD